MNTLRRRTIQKWADDDADAHVLHVLYDLFVARGGGNGSDGVEVHQRELDLAKFIAGDAGSLVFSPGTNGPAAMETITEAIKDYLVFVKV